MPVAPRAVTPARRPVYAPTLYYCASTCCLPLRCGYDWKVWGGMGSYGMGKCGAHSTASGARLLKSIGPRQEGTTGVQHHASVLWSLPQPSWRIDQWRLPRHWRAACAAYICCIQESAGHMAVAPIAAALARARSYVHCWLLAGLTTSDGCTQNGQYMRIRSDVLQVRHEWACMPRRYKPNIAQSSPLAAITAAAMGRSLRSVGLASIFFTMSRPCAFTQHKGQWMNGMAHQLAHLVSAWQR